MWLINSSTDLLSLLIHIIDVDAFILSSESRVNVCLFCFFPPVIQLIVQANKCDISHLVHIYLYDQQ